MASIGAVIDRINSFEKELEKQLQKVQLSIEPDKRESFTQKVESEQSKRLERIEILREEASRNLETVETTGTENASSIEEAVEMLKEVGQYIPQEKQDELVREVGLPLLESNIQSVEVLSKEISLSSNKQFVKGWHKLYKKAERMWRLTLLLTPFNQQQFESTVMWVAEQGEEAELATLQKIKNNPPYNSSKIQQLLDYAQQRIETRLREKVENHRVFCSQNELEQRFQGIQVVKSYPAFTIILASAKTIADIKQSFPVERLEFQKEPNPNIGVSNMTDKRDQVVQFNAPVCENWKQRIEETGAKILQPLGRLEVVVSVPSEDSEDIVNQIRNFEEVAQVTPYVPKVRVQPQYLQNLRQKATKEAIAAARLKAARNPPSSQNRSIPLPGILIANFFSQADRDRAAQNLEAIGIRIANRPGTTRLVLDLSSDSDAMGSLKTITEQIGLQSLGEKTIPSLFNCQARSLIGEGVIRSNPTPSLSLTGKGEIIAVADTGLDTGDAETLHPDFLERVKMIQSYPITTALPEQYLLNFGDDDGPSDKYSGHGTHVAGSILGSGEQARELGLSSIEGIAPEAELIFQAVEQTPKWTLEGILFYLETFGIMPPPSELLGIPDDLQALFQPAYNNGAKIHSNSWGGVYLGIYDISYDKPLDEFVWNHKDFLVVVAAGNAGKHSSSGTKAIDQGNVDSPGTAKNCLTVGASENNRVGEFSDTYGNWWPEEFPYEPFKSNCMVDSIDDIAAFSSRGPCQDGRRKPDVIAPGTFILSTRSSQIARNNFAWGAYPPARWHYMYMGGTSMATPLVAGCAALVRQYLRKNEITGNPSAALVKAVLIHSAEYINYPFPHPSSSPWADNEQGWGRINLRRVLNPTEPIKVLFIDKADGLVTGQKHQYTVEIADNTVPLKATLVYTDYPGESLINNLNLILYSFSGRCYVGNDFERTGEPDTINNVEGVAVESPEIGMWRIEIVAEVQQEQQDYALVISAGGLVRV